MRGVEREPSEDAGVPADPGRGEVDGEAQRPQREAGRGRDQDGDRPQHYADTEAGQVKTCYAASLGDREAYPEIQEEQDGAGADVSGGEAGGTIFEGRRDLDGPRGGGQHHRRRTEAMDQVVRVEAGRVDRVPEFSASDKHPYPNGRCRKMSRL